VSYTTFDIIGNLSFGESFHYLDEGVATEWAVAITKVLYTSALNMAVRRVTGVGSLLNRVALKLMPKEAMKWRRISFINTHRKTSERTSSQIICRGAQLTSKKASPMRIPPIRTFYITFNATKTPEKALRPPSSSST